MKILSLSGVALLASGLLVGAPANAQGRETGWEFGFDVIYQDGTDIDFDGGSSASLNDDFGLAVTFGYRFNEKLELQFALDWEDIDYDVLIQSAPPSFPAQQFRGSGSLESFTPRVS